jgi:hypothetical protein
MGAQNRFQLLQQRRLEIDARDQLLLTVCICFLPATHIVHMTAALPRCVGAPHPFSALRTIEESREQRVYLAVPHSASNLDFELLLHSLP